jgi:hypothetical protein
VKGIDRIGWRGGGGVLRCEWKDIVDNVGCVHLA